MQSNRAASYQIEPNLFHLGLLVHVYLFAALDCGVQCCAVDIWGLYGSFVDVWPVESSGVYSVNNSSGHKMSQEVFLLECLDLVLCMFHRVGKFLRKKSSSANNGETMLVTLLQRRWKDLTTVLLDYSNGTGIFDRIRFHDVKPTAHTSILSSTPDPANIPFLLSSLSSDDTLAKECLRQFLPEEERQTEVDDVHLLQSVLDNIPMESRELKEDLQRTINVHRAARDALDHSNILPSQDSISETIPSSFVSTVHGVKRQRIDIPQAVQHPLVSNHMEHTVTDFHSSQRGSMRNLGGHGSSFINPSSSLVRPSGQILLPSTNSSPARHTPQITHTPYVPQVAQRSSSDTRSTHGMTSPPPLANGSALKTEREKTEREKTEREKTEREKTERERIEREKEVSQLLVGSKEMKSYTGSPHWKSVTQCKEGRLRNQAAYLLEKKCIQRDAVTKKLEITEEGLNVLWSFEHEGTPMVDLTGKTPEKNELDEGNADAASQRGLSSGGGSAPTTPKKMKQASLVTVGNKNQRTLTNRLSVPTPKPVFTPSESSKGEGMKTEGVVDHGPSIHPLFDRRGETQQKTNVVPMSQHFTRNVRNVSSVPGNFSSRDLSSPLSRPGLLSGLTSLSPSSHVTIIEETPEPEVELSEEQTKVLALAMDGRSFYLTGAAGTGKSFLLGRIIKILKKLHGYDSVFVTASTGIAACNIGGSTVHSFAGFGIGDKDVESLVSMVEANANSKKRWLSANVLVIDEISMVSADFFDKLEYVARRIRKEEKPFG
ncbi:hypothetical protein PROFUN_15443, partial [Planoprotostelium fungivorum]